MRPWKNKFNNKAFEEAKIILEKMHPQVARRGFFIAGLDKSGVLPASMKGVAVSAVCELVQGSLTFRAYRRPKGSSPLSYKVDEIRDIDKVTAQWVSPQETENHHMTDEVPDDIMRRTQMAYEFISDGRGGLKPNVQPDGMIKAYINFPDPYAETSASRRPSRQNTLTGSDPKRLNR